MKQKKGYSQFVQSLVACGDYIVLNLVFGVLYLLFGDYLSPLVEKDYRLLFLLLNLSYLPSVLLVTAVVHERIVYAERILERVFYTVLLHFFVFFSCLLIIKFDELSRKFLFTFYVSFFFMLFFWRLGVRLLLKCYRKRGHNYTNVVIVGGGKNGKALADEMLSDPAYGFRILGFFDDNPSSLPPDASFLGTTSCFESYLSDEHTEVDAVYCALPELAEQIIMRMLNYCESNMIRFHVVPEIRRYLKKKLQMDLLGEIPILIIREEPLQNAFNRFVKRSFDLVFSSFFLLFLFLPLTVVIGLAIKLTSKGPLFFVQKRTGKSGKEFSCYKFRTMYVNGEAHTKQTVKNDPRITPIGAFLRHTNLDEIPQFINVLKGDMSVVGPRPHMLKHTEMYSKLIDKYMIRHLIKPGITGWAQVTGYRGETQTLEEMEGRVRRDVWYLENWTFWLDIKIIVRTIVNMFVGEEKAY